MNTRSTALRSRLEFRIRHLSTQHPSTEIKAQAAQLLATPTADGFRELWLSLNVYGPTLLIEDVLIDAGLDVCAAAWAKEKCDA